MSIIISGRHVQVSDAMKEYGEEKLNAINAEYHKITSARMILDVEKSRQRAELIVHGKNLDVEASHECFDMYEAIDHAVEKAVKQIRRHFDKVQDHHKNVRLPDPAVEPTDDELDEEEEF